jgi:hypothetical protein
MDGLDRLDALHRLEDGRDASTRTRVNVDLAVPVYVHPQTNPQLWRRLADAAAYLRFVVVNVHSGPGEQLDPSYPEAIERLREVRIRPIGYVNTCYGDRPVQEVIDDARTWVTRYGVQGVFLDHAAGGFGHLEYYGAAALGARSTGAQFVVLNPGTHCHPGYADIANVIVTFEGAWEDYLRHRPKEWQLRLPAPRFCHLVHDVPGQRLSEGPTLAAARHAGTVLLVDGAGHSPWGQLPDELVSAVQRAHPGAVAPTALSDQGWQPRQYIAVRPGFTVREPLLFKAPGPPVRHGRRRAQHGKTPPLRHRRDGG